MPLAVTVLKSGGNVQSKSIFCLTKETVRGLKERGAELIYNPVENRIPIHEVERTF